jgi:hypothetical protein
MIFIAVRGVTGAEVAEAVKQSCVASASSRRIHTQHCVGISVQNLMFMCTRECATVDTYAEAEMWCLNQT